MQLIKYVEALEGFQSISNEKLPVSQSYKLAKMISSRLSAILLQGQEQKKLSKSKRSTRLEKKSLKRL